MKSELFTAQEIGDAIGWTRQAVYRALGAIPRSGIKASRRNADAWSITALPGVIRAELCAVHDRLKFRAEYRTLADVLTNPPGRWEPALPLGDVHADEIAHAQRLQRALGRGLALPDHATDTDRARAVADDYRQEFGHGVSERHLRALIRRALDRDREAGAFDRLELYLPEAPRPRVAAPPALASSPFDFAWLEFAFSICADRTRPTAADKQHCWDAVMTFCEETTAGGEIPRGFRPAMFAFLHATLPRLGKSPPAIEKAFERKLARFREKGRAGLADLREENSGRGGKLPADYVANMDLAREEVRDLHGDISQAFRNLWRGTSRSGHRFSDSFREYFSHDSRLSKSYVPNRVRTALRAWWNAIEPFTKGPKAVRLATPAIQLDWSRIPAGYSYTGDDFTLNHPFYVWDEEGEYECLRGRFNVTRGQVLLFSDERSRKILGYNAIPERTYNASHIQQGLAKLCLNPAIGLPFKRFHLEQSLWKAKAVTGMVDWTELVAGFEREEKIQLIHALSPRAKSIESVGGRIQAIMEAAPFYVGRNERLDNHEREQAFLGSLKRVDQPRKEMVDPADMMMSWEEFLRELDRCIELYNHEPQAGPNMLGRSPEEVWAQESGLQMHRVLPDSLAYLLSSAVSEQKVQGGVGKKSGVRSPDGQFWYSDSERIGELVGEKVRVRFNPSLPEIVMVCHLATDPKERAPFAVGIGPMLPACDATAEEFAAAKAKQKRFMSHGRAQFKAFPPKRNATIRRETMGSEDARATGEAIQAIEAGHREIQTSRARHARSITKAAERFNLGISQRAVRNPEKVAEALRNAEIAEAKIRLLEAEQDQ